MRQQPRRGYTTKEINPGGLELSNIKPKKTLQIEIDSSANTEEQLSGEPMSPAYKNNKDFKRAASKMPPVGNES